jgi:hypothetical protein
MRRTAISGFIPLDRMRLMLRDRAAASILSAIGL